MLTLWIARIVVDIEESKCSRSFTFAMNYCLSFPVDMTILIFLQRWPAFFSSFIEVQHLKRILGLVGLHLNGQAIIDIFVNYL